MNNDISLKNNLIVKEVNKVDEYYTKEESDEKFQPKNDEKLDTRNKTIVGSINEINARMATGWIIGQYVWMSSTVAIMPTGWKRVEFTLGYTLINATEAQTDLDAGKNKKIRFWATENQTGGTEVRSTSSNRHFGYSAGTAVGWDVDKAFLTPASKVQYDKQSSQGTTTYSSSAATSSDANAEANYAAGMYGALWQYDPNNIFSDLSNVIHTGENSWRNFEASRLSHENTQTQELE